MFNACTLGEIFRDVSKNNKPDLSFRKFHDENRTSFSARAAHVGREPKRLKDTWGWGREGGGVGVKSKKLLY